MIPNPTSKGKTTEAIILAALVNLGKTVLLPWGEERYDFALDEGTAFVRVQCKTGVLRNGGVVFKTCITDARRPLGDGGYAGQVDAFGVYCPQLKQRFWFPRCSGFAVLGLSSRRTAAQWTSAQHPLGTRLRIAHPADGACRPTGFGR